MKAIILAAGLSQRLRPLTNKKPKCLLDIRGKTILDIIIENCIKNHLIDILIIAGHGRSFIEQLVEKNIAHSYRLP